MGEPGWVSSGVLWPISRFSVGSVRDWGALGSPEVRQQKARGTVLLSEEALSPTKCDSRVIVVV